MPHDLIHQLKFIALQIMEAKSYTTSFYAQEALDKAYDMCGKAMEQAGKQLISETEEKV